MEPGAAPLPHLQAYVAFLLPGISVSLQALKPEAVGLQGDSLGSRIRCRRRELELDRRAAAAVLGVNQKSLASWERNEWLPTVAAYPALIRFLGYEPWPEPTSLSEALVAERRRRGLVIKQAAQQLGVDEGTLGSWERGEWKPTGRTAPALSEWIGVDVRRAFPNDVR